MKFLNRSLIFKVGFQRLETRVGEDEEIGMHIYIKIYTYNLISSFTQKLS